MVSRRSDGKRFSCSLSLATEALKVPVTIVQRHETDAMLAAEVHILRHFTRSVTLLNQSETCSDDHVEWSQALSKDCGEDSTQYGADVHCGDNVQCHAFCDVCIYSEALHVVEWRIHSEEDYEAA